MKIRIVNETGSPRSTDVYDSAGERIDWIHRIIINPITAGGDRIRVELQFESAIMDIVADWPLDDAQQQLALIAQKRAILDQCEARILRMLTPALPDGYFAPTDEEPSR